MSKVKITNQNSKLFQRVYEVVKRIPSGKVATYGQIAEILGTKDARKIGWSLHANRNPKVPCHRVVNQKGRLAPNFAFDGAVEQRKRLLDEGVKFINEIHVDLDKCLWKRR